MGPNHPWRHRLDRTFNKKFSPDDFTKDWLLDLNTVDLSLPSIAIMNGWGAQHTENRWWADALSERISSMFAYDSRGQGSSTKEGDLDAIQNAIDANRLIGVAFDDLDHRASSDGVKPGPKLLEGHCIGAMTVAAAFAGRFPIIDRIDASILISPVSTFDLPLLAKFSYFLPDWFGRWMVGNFASPLSKYFAPGEGSEYSRQKALDRIARFDVSAAFRQARQIFWRENVEKLWRTINKPALMLVSPNDPLTKLEDSARVYDLLPYPIWLELEAPDHLILEDNVEFLSRFVPEFAEDPWGVYEENKDRAPAISR